MMSIFEIRSGVSRSLIYAAEGPVTLSSLEERNSKQSPPMMLRSLLVSTCLLVVHGLALNEFNFDNVWPFPETVPDDDIGYLMQAFKPYLNVPHGCVPHPSVDAEGNVGRGIEVQPAKKGPDCRHHAGQIYARSADVHEYLAIMYSWYMPRTGIWPEGHRHDWQNAVFFLNTSDWPNTAALHAITCTTNHGNYRKYFGGRATDETHFHLEYYRNWPHNHQLGPSRDTGGMQPLVAWDSLTDEARETLNLWDYGKTVVPFNDEHLTEWMEKAYLVHDH